MSDQTASGEDRASGPRSSGGQGSNIPPPVPRWVKILGLALVALLLVAVLAMLLSGGDHGPGRHGALAAPSTAVVAGISFAR